MYVELRHMKILLIALLIGPLTAVAYAQKMDRPKDLEVGDKVTFKWMRNNKPFTLEQEVTAVTDTQVQAIERFGGNESELTWTKSPLLVKNALCMSNALPCIYDPGVEIVQFPLEKGKKWPSKFAVKGPDFVAQVESERTVEGVEKIKVLAGEFDAYRVSFNSRYRGTTNKGANFNGKDEGTVWYALSNAKLVAVKTEYKNSSGEKSVRELMAVSYK